MRYLLVALLIACPALAQPLPHDRPQGEPEVVATFDGAMPTGVTVSADNRLFLCFPRWGDEVPHTVAELVDGRTVAYPPSGVELVSVQSVVVDPADRLWILDTGRVEWQPTVPGGAKLVGVDLETDRVFKTIVFPPDVALDQSYLNDVRFDLSRGAEGMAFITDSSSAGKNALIVVDLATGEAWRRLPGHPSVLPEPRFLPLVEGRPLMNRPADGPATHLSVGADGIALGPKGQMLYYSPLAGRHLYSVSIDELVEGLPNRTMGDKVVDLGDKGGASDGLESDSSGAVYLTNYEHNAILRREADGSFTTLVQDPRVLWPDTLSLSRDGYLYFTANQLHRQPQFHNGRDLRVKPYLLFRLRVDRQPVLLRR